VILCYYLTIPQQIWYRLGLIIADLHTVFAFYVFIPIAEW